MQFSKKILPNGLRLITVPMKDNPTVTVLVMVEAGSKYETKDISGISHFLEHMCFKGTKRRPTSFDIARELDTLGARSNAFTAAEFTGYYAKVKKNDFLAALDVVSDIYLNPAFDPKEIEKEKGVIVEEIKMYEDSPRKFVYELFTALLHGDQPAGWNIAGTRESVQALTLNALLAYRAKHYVPEATCVVVAGNVSEEEAVQAVEKKFSSMTALPKEQKTKTLIAQSAPAIALRSRDIDQAHIIFGVRGYDLFSKKSPAADVLSSILGGGMSSRLFQKLRDEMGVAYSVGAYHSGESDHGVFAVSAGVDKNRVEEVLRAITAECAKLRKELVGDEELARAKSHMTGSLSLELEGSDSLAHFYGLQEIAHKPILLESQAAEEITAVTAEDVRYVAREIFIDRHINFAMVSSEKNEGKFLPLLTFGK